MSDPIAHPRPVILVSASLASPFAGPEMCSALSAEAHKTIERLGILGAEVRFVEASAPDAPAERLITSSIHGLIVLGGADIDPGLYGQAANTDTLYGVNRAADDHEAALITCAMAQDVPVLGICRGLQLLNVVLGGTLVQDLGQPTMHNGSADNTIMASHRVEILPGTRLAEITGGQPQEILSGHHQAIDRLANSLRPSARAADGLIEAVEGVAGPWVLGVQWHPEEPDAPTDVLDTLLAGFLSACRA